MPEPRTVEGQAAVSGMRPHLRKAFGKIIAAIEDQAAAPYLEALREADRLLEDLAARDASTAWDAAARADLVQRAAAARQMTAPLLSEAFVQHGPTASQPHTRS